jgi:hypothetical protein
MYGWVTYFCASHGLIEYIVPGTAAGVWVACAATRRGTHAARKMLVTVRCILRHCSTQLRLRFRVGS